MLAELKRLLEIPCQVFDPAIGLDLPAGDYSAFTLALGLAVGGAAKLSFDFAHPKRPGPAPDVRRQRLLIAAACACALLLAVVLGRAVLLGRGGSELADLNRQINDLRQTNTKLKTLSNRVAGIERWQGQEPEWLDQLANFSFTIPPAEEVYVSGFRTSSGKVTLDLKAKDDKSLTRFTHDLKAITGYEPEPKGTSPAFDRYGYGIKSTLEVDVSGKARCLIAASQPVGRPADDSLLKPQPAPQAAVNRPSATTQPAAAAPTTPGAPDRPNPTRSRRRPAP